MSLFKAQPYLIIICCGMVAQILPHHLGEEDLTDPSQEKDLDLQTINNEDLNPHTVNFMNKEIPYPRADSHLNKQEDTISYPRQDEAIKNQNQSRQVPSNADGFSSKTGTSKNSSLENNLIEKDNDKETQQEKTMRKSNTVYAFTAELSSNTDVSQGSVIIFDRVSVNEGEMYFNNSGYFVCPDNGVYMFAWTVMMVSSSSSRCLTSLTVGGEDIKYGPKTSYYSGRHSGTSQMAAVVHCRSSPLTGVAVVSAIIPAPSYYMVVVVTPLSLAIG